VILKRGLLLTGKYNKIKALKAIFSEDVWIWTGNKRHFSTSHNVELVIYTAGIAMIVL
jgi:hypothetical protein